MQAASALLKTCTTCKATKPATAEYFHAYARSPDGRRSVCRVCRAADHAAHSAERAAKKKEHYAANRERIAANARDYYKQNAEAQRATALKRHYRNREERIAQMRDYRAANRDELIAKQRERNSEEFRSRYRTDLAYTLRHRMRSLLRVTLTNGREGKRMQELLGFSMEDLKAHLERQFHDGMDWEQFMQGKIHIDHITPVASFNITGVDCPEFKACWSLANLQPMWASQNHSKGAKALTLL